LRGLGATLTEAERIQTLEQHVARENLFHSQASAARSHAALSKAGADLIAKGIALEVEGWRQMTAHMDKAKNACPVGFAWPMDWPNLGELARLTLEEAYRLGGEGDATGSVSPRSLPGAKPVPELGANLPDRITPLTDLIAGFCDRVSAKFKEHAEATFKRGAD